MQQIIPQTIEYDEMGLPPILYKYRDWNNPNHKKILTENEIYLASPADFEDEYDCKIPIRYDLLTEEEIYDLYFKSSLSMNHHFAEQQHINYALEHQQKGLLLDAERIRELEKCFFDNFNNRFGVLSLTAACDKYAMWDYYANHNKGFCIGFHSLALCKTPNLFSGGGIMHYYDVLPIIKFTDQNEKKYFYQVHSKLRKWKFEEEYRLTKSLTLNRKANIPNEVYAEIILGSCISEVSRQEIIQLAKIKFKNCKVLQANLSNKKITLTEA
ncbi:MAG: DUF2971 domain-containing protein [Lentimicrobium sp.]